MRYYVFNLMPYSINIVVSTWVNTSKTPCHLQSCTIFSFSGAICPRWKKLFLPWASPRCATTQVKVPYKKESSLLSRPPPLHIAQSLKITLKVDMGVGRGRACWRIWKRYQPLSIPIARHCAWDLEDGARVEGGLEAPKTSIVLLFFFF